MGFRLESTSHFLGTIKSKQGHNTKTDLRKYCIHEGNKYRLILQNTLLQVYFALDQII